MPLISEHLCRLCEKVLFIPGLHYLSDDSKTRLSFVRIPKDHSLMVEGHHVSSDDKSKEQRSPREQKGASLLPEFSLDDSNGNTVTKSKGMFFFLHCVIVVWL